MFDSEKSFIGNGVVAMQGTNNWDTEGGDCGQSQYTVAVGPNVTVLHASASVANAHFAHFFKTPTLPEDTDFMDFTQNLLDMLAKEKDTTRYIDELIKAVAKENNLEPVSVVASSEDGDIDLSTVVRLHLDHGGPAEAMNDTGATLNSTFVNNMLPNKLLDTAFVAGLKNSLKIK